MKRTHSFLHELVLDSMQIVKTDSFKKVNISGYQADTSGQKQNENLAAVIVSD